MQAWFETSIKSRDRSELFNEWWSGEDEKLTEDVSDILFDTISYYDYKKKIFIMRLLPECFQAQAMR
ncbi:MAG: hypothetical protein LIP12_18195 [Clostridiales bacterium]|nr:hypothetical protein [Clostridiales bacterium]